MTEKGIAIILIGIPASGKSTFAATYCPFAVRINLDTLHTRSKEKKAISECLLNNRSFVIDNTNPRKADRAEYIRQAKEAGYQVIGYFLSSKVSECIERNAERIGKACVPNHVIAHISNILELPSYEEGFDKLYYVTMQSGGFVIDEWR